MTVDNFFPLLESKVHCSFIDTIVVSVSETLLRNPMVSRRGKLDVSMSPDPSDFAMFRPLTRSPDRGSNPNHDKRAGSCGAAESRAPIPPRQQIHCP